MFFLPFSVFLFILFILLIPILFVFFQIGIISLAFSKLGLTPFQGLMIFFLSLIGSTINIPIKEYYVERDNNFKFPNFLSFFFNVPEVSKKVIAINLGGAVIPIILSIFLLPRLPVLPTLICTFLMIIISKKLSKPIPGAGIMLPAFIPPLFSAIFALMFATYHAPLVAYFSGTIGTLIGADILNLPKILKKPFYGVISIGGAGIYDGIFLVGIISVLLS